jgi:hypothetical protein
LKRLYAKAACRRSDIVMLLVGEQRLSRAGILYYRCHRGSGFALRPIEVASHVA